MRMQMTSQIDAGGNDPIFLMSKVTATTKAR